MKEEMDKGFLKKINPMWIFLCVAVGICLMLYSGIDKAQQESVAVISSLENGDPREYESFVEGKVKEICSSIGGVGNISVAVSLSGGYRAVYAVNSQSSAAGYKNEIVTTGSGSAEKPLVVGYEYPQIIGIGIVCDGGSNADIKKNIISLVSSAFNISTNKIEVVG